MKEIKKTEVSTCSTGPGTGVQAHREIDHVFPSYGGGVDPIYTPETNSKLAPARSSRASKGNYLSSSNHPFSGRNMLVLERSVPLSLIPES